MVEAIRLVKSNFYRLGRAYPERLSSDPQKFCGSFFQNRTSAFQVDLETTLL
jgi:hypothetical protein